MIGISISGGPSVPILIRLTVGYNKKIDDYILKIILLPYTVKNARNSYYRHIFYNLVHSSPQKLLPMVSRDACLKHHWLTFRMMR